MVRRQFPPAAATSPRSLAEGTETRGPVSKPARRPRRRRCRRRGTAWRCRACRRGRLQRVEQRRQHAGAASADRVAEGDRAAVDVDLRGVDAKLANDRHAPAPRRPRSARRGRRPRSVPAGLLRHLPRGLDRRHQHASSARGRSWPAPRCGPAAAAPRALALVGRHHDQRRRAVVDRRRVAGRDRAVLLEGRLEGAAASPASCRRAPTRPWSNITGAPFFCGISTGRISAANLPAAMAAAAFRWLSAAYSSCSSRVTL